MKLPWSHKERVRRRAAMWLARIDDGLAPTDKAALDEWLGRDAAHRAAFERQAAFLSIAVPRTSPVARGRSLEDAYPGTRPSGPRRGLATAGALAIAALGLVAIAGPRPFLRDPPLQSVMLSAGPVDRHYRLSDGSSLTLAAASVIDVRISSVERRAELKTGRARIVIASDPRPFHVVAGGDDMGVMRGTLVATVSGKAGAVAIEPAGAATASHVPAATPAGAPGQLSHLASPPTAPIEFAGTRLDEVVARVNAADDDGRLQLLDPSLGARRVTGVYRRGDVAGLARALAAAFDLDVEKGAGGLVSLRPRK